MRLNVQLGVNGNHEGSVSAVALREGVEEGRARLE